MSRQTVEQAISLAAGGSLADALRLLARLDVDFVRKRLTHHLRSVERDREAALLLWRDLFPAQEPPAQTTRGSRTSAPPSMELLAGPLVPLPPRLILENPGPTLAAVDRAPPFAVDLDQLQVAQIFSLVAFAALARRREGVTVRASGDGAVARFARAVGIQQVIAGLPPPSPNEPERSIPLRRVTSFQEIEPAASEIASLILPHDEEARPTIRYVLVELLRNVIQHSHDPLGGVVAAQRMDRGQLYDRPVVQVAVADAGRGILEALKAQHPELKEPAAAIEKALRPHISGTFEEGLTGSIQNAGMGLFFVSEMAKMTAGRLLLASRGAALLIRGLPDLGHTADLVPPPGCGFPGTLAVFELALGEIQNFEALFATIKDRAMERRPKRALHHWLRFEEPPPQPPLKRFIVSVSEDTMAAQRLGQREFEPRILNRESLLLDFRGIKFCTQSYLHALLFETLRLAWARRVPIYVAHAEPAVRSGLELLEDYALGG